MKNNYNYKNNLIMIGGIIVFILLIRNITDLTNKFKNSLNKTETIETTPKPVPSQIPIIIPPFEFEEIINISEVSLNKIDLDESDTSPLKFLLAGHIYGKPNNDDFHPAKTFINNIEYFRNSDFDMVIFLGDIIRNHFQNDFDDLENYILTEFDIPVFNAVGNHDMIYREDYYERYGRTVYAFTYKNNLFIFLDTNLNNGDLDESMVIFIELMVNKYKSDQELNNIHIFMHNLLFLNDLEVIEKQIISPNKGTGSSEIFQKMLRDVIYPASKYKPFYFYAGDVGAFTGSNLSPFYKKDQNHNVTYIATGIGNYETDSVIFGEETKDGIQFSPFSLTGKDMREIEYYDFDYWFIQPQP